MALATNAGLGSTSRGNVELGVVLSTAQRAQAVEIFENWWKTATPVTAAKIAEFAALPKIRVRHDSLAGIGPALEVPDPVDLEAIMGGADAAASRRYWIKSNYHRREAEGQGWWWRGWISDWRKASYGTGDLILLYLSAKKGGPGLCPAIVQVTAPPAHEPDFVNRYAEPGDEGHWPFVTRTRCIFDVPVQQGIQPSAIGVDPHGLQAYKKIGRRQFELAAQHLMAASRG